MEMTAFCAFLQQHKKAFNEINFLKEENVKIVGETKMGQML